MNEKWPLLRPFLRLKPKLALETEHILHIV